MWSFITDVYDSIKELPVIKTPIRESTNDVCTHSGRYYYDDTMGYTHEGTFTKGDRFPCGSLDGHKEVKVVWTLAEEDLPINWTLTLLTIAWRVFLIAVAFSLLRYILDHL